MSSTVLELALAAALLHAFWNLLLHRAPNKQALSAAALVVVPFIALIPGIPRLLSSPPEALFLLAASIACHVSYFVLLSFLYARFEISTLYPLSRGTAILLAAYIDFMFGYALQGMQLVGLAVVFSAFTVLYVSAGRASLKEIASGLALGLTIAVANNLDRAAMGMTDATCYVPALFFTTGLILVGLRAFHARERIGLSTLVDPRSLIVGVAVTTSYMLVLACLRTAPLSAVLALRETSIVVTTIAGAVISRESFGYGKGAGMALLCLGVFLMA